MRSLPSTINVTWASTRVVLEVLELMMTVHDLVVLVDAVLDVLLLLLRRLLRLLIPLLS